MQIKKDESLTHTIPEDVDIVFLPAEFSGEALDDLIDWQQMDKKRKIVLLACDHVETFALNGKVSIRYIHSNIKESFLNILWEHVFMKTFLFQPENKVWQYSDIFISLSNGVHLVASEYSDFGVGVYKNVRENALSQTNSFSFSKLKDSLKDIPAVICGAGASLLNNLDHLKELSSNTIIASGGAALPILSRNSIDVHLSAGLDPDPDRERFLLSSFFQVPFFYQKRFSSQMLSLIQGKKVALPSSKGYLFEEWLELDAGQELCDFEGGWTVATLLLALLSHMGCSPILLVGVDLSYKDTMYADENRKADTLEAKKGLITKPDWVQAKEWIEDFALQHPENMIISTSSLTIFSHCKNISLKEANPLLKTEEMDLKGLVHSIIEKASVKGSFNRYKKAFDEFDQSLTSSEKILSSLVELFSLYHPHSPVEKGEFILLEYDLYEEVFYKNVLKPLWDVWQHVFARYSFSSEQEMKLQQILFFPNSSSALYENIGIHMTLRMYCLDKGRYILSDAELSLNIDEEFIFSLLPEDPSQMQSLCHIEYDEDGRVCRVYSMQDGLKHGLARHYHPNGGIFWEGYYKSGYLHGPSKYFSERAKILSHTWFYQGQEIGISYQYNIEGTLVSKQSFIKGVLHGAQEHYFEDGSIKTLMHYIMGKLHGSVELFFPNGSLKRSCYFVGGKKQGTDRIFSEDGIVLDEGCYEGGAPIGVHVRRYRSGQIREEISYSPEGNIEKKAWDEQGILLEGALSEPSL